MLAPKKMIPSLALAALSLTGTGCSGASPAENLNNSVRAFCMKLAECGYYDSTDECVAEYQYDNRDAPFFPLGDNDVAFGARLTFNDVQDTDVLAFVAIDTDNGSRFGSLEANRRVGASGEVRLEARLFAEVDRADPLAFLRRDDYVQLEFIRYF